MLKHTTNEPSIFRTKDWVEINNKSGWTHNCDIRFNSTILKLNLYEYTDEYIPVKGTIKFNEAGAVVATQRASEWNKQVTLKVCASFTNCIRKIKHAQVKYAKKVDVVMPIYTFWNNSDNYSKKHQNVNAIMQRWTKR